MWVGIVFESGSPNWTYRLLVNGTYSPTTDLGSQTVPASSDEYGKYFDTGLHLIQRYIDAAILLYETGGSGAIPPPTGYRRMPADGGGGGGDAPWIFQWLAGWCLNAGMMFYFNAMVGRMVFARERRIERALLLAGASRAAYWLHWAVEFLPPLLAISALQTGVAFLTDVAHYSDPLLVWLWLLLYCLASLAVAVAAAGFLTIESAGGVGVFGAFLLSASWIGVLLGGAPQPVRLLLVLLSPWYAGMDGGSRIVDNDYLGRGAGVRRFLGLRDRTPLPGIRAPLPG